MARRLDTLIDNIDVGDLKARPTTRGTIGPGVMIAKLLEVDTMLDREVAISRIIEEAACDTMGVQ